jgi:hypothetical protein
MTLRAEEIPALIAKYGEPQKLAEVDCSKAPPGTICSTTKCIDGYILVQRCDTSKGCTEYDLIPC